jgi:hypothetical protein
MIGLSVSVKQGLVGEAARNSQASEVVQAVREPMERLRAENVAPLNHRHRTQLRN